jgi:hypothetical protein
VLTKREITMKYISITKLIYSVFLITLMVPVSPSYAGKLITIEGSLKGAICVHYKLGCADDDAHIAMETDFVLLLPGGQHYFLPNLSPTMKAKYANRDVRITGEMREHSIGVDKLEIKMDGTYKTVWSWKQQQELYKQQQELYKGGN